jgi:hypothetical protein
LNSNGNVLNNSNLNFNITNSIISGNENIEFLIEQFDDSNLNFKFKNCMIKFNDYNEIFTGQNNYDFLNLEKYENIYLNLNTDFKNEYNNELFILQNSEVINLGDQQLAAIYPLDLLNINRENSPDLGAYQHVIIED